MSGNKEIELKLLVDRSDLKRLMQTERFAACIRPGSEYTRTLRSTYYDTRDMQFRQKGLAYRVRDKGNGTFEATVKASLKNQGGLSQRLELNLPLKDEAPVLEGFCQLGLGFELSALAPSGVEELFTVLVERTTYLLDIDGAVIELALDAGAITAGAKKDKIDEIELELLEGDESTLLKLAADISGQIPLFVEKRSKYARGLALLGYEADVSIGGPAPEAAAYDDPLELAQACGDRLLEDQNVLKLKVLEQETCERIWDELLTLSAVAELCGLSTGNNLLWLRLLDEALKAAGDFFAAARTGQLLDEFCRKSSILAEREPLRLELLKKENDYVKELCRMAQQGRFSAIYYGLISAFLGAEAGKETVTSEKIQARKKAVEKLQLRDMLRRIKQATTGELPGAPDAFTDWVLEQEVRDAGGNFSN